jgi:hypothetical protein
MLLHFFDVFWCFVRFELVENILLQLLQTNDILYYDISLDNTLQKIKDYQIKNNKLQIIINNEPPLEYRTHRIAKGRNSIIQMIKDKYSNYEYFIMMDCDYVCANKIHLTVLKNYLLVPETWDSLSFNREDYYDVWALSIPPYIVSVRHFHNIGKAEQIMKKFITKKLNNLEKNQLLTCLSAFNGFSIYKTPKFLNCNYDGRLRLDLLPMKMIKLNEKVINDKLQFIYNKEGCENTIYEDCEHRSFHLQAIKKNNAKICISPHILFN